MTSKEDFKISVLIPFYNAEAFFNECIASVFNQTFPPAEVVIVNDAANESTRKYLAQYEDRAKIVYLPYKSGAPAARNVAIREASHEWIAFQDADDIWEPDKLLTQIEYLQQHPGYVGCHTGVTTFNGAGIINQYVDKPSPLKTSDLMMSSHVTPPSLLIRKEAVVTLGGFDENFVTSSDYEFSIRLASAGYQLGFVPKALIRVRRDNHGSVSSNGLRTFRNHLRLVRKHRQVFLKGAGLNGTRRFLAKSLQESGGKIGGKCGRFARVVGRVLAI